MSVYDRLPWRGGRGRGKGIWKQPWTTARKGSKRSAQLRCMRESKMIAGSFPSKESRWTNTLGVCVNGTSPFHVVRKDVIKQGSANRDLDWKVGKGRLYMAEIFKCWNTYLPRPLKWKLYQDESTHLVFVSYYVYYTVCPDGLHT